MNRHFTVDARAILNLGRESIRDHTTAVLELVKNSYDADATRVDVDLRIASADPTQRYIRIRDNGSGMTEKELREQWLRIGYSAKRHYKYSPILHRRTTGEKGIGRISADRIGAVLDLVTASPNAAKPTGLRIRWNAFEPDGRALEDVPIEEIDAPKFSYETSTPPTLPKWEYPKQGTELTSTGLRHLWVEDDILRLRKELSAFVSPHEEVSDFDLYLYTDLAEGLSGHIENDLPEAAAIDLTAQFDGKEKISYAITRRVGTGTRSEKASIPWNQLIQRTGAAAKTAPQSAGSLGPAKVRLLFYPRKSEISALSKLSLEALREFLDDNAGVAVYRDSIRVRPYGDGAAQGGDWLRLGERKTREPAGAGRESFRVSPNQLVGAVFVTRDGNADIVDSAGREGLVQNDAFRALQYFTLGCITILEATYHRAFVEHQQQSDPKSGDTTVQVTKLNTQLARLAEELTTARKELPKAGGRAAQRSAQKIAETLEVLQSASKSIEVLASQATIYRGLATTGIAATVFGHETQSAISQVEGSIQTASLLLEQQPPNVTEALDEVAKARLFASRVASWGAFALSRVQRDKRRRRATDVRKLAEGLVKEMAPVFSAVDISLQPQIEAVAGRTFAMDVESVLVNLLTNAYSACQQVARERVVGLVVRPRSEKGQHGVEIIVSDSGPGVAVEFRDRVWDPLFTTKVGADGKQVGTGLGLSIVDSIVDEMRGSRKLTRDPQLKGAKFEVWLPLG